MITDYDDAFPAPRPISKTIAYYLQQSFSVSDILRRIARGWLIIIIGGVLGFFYGVYTVWITPPSFTATMNLLPADSSGGGLSGDSGDSTLGLLAGLAGVNSGSVPKFTRFIAAMPSEGVARLLDKKYNMLCRVFAGQCDLKTGQWREATGQDAWIAAQLAHLAHQPDPNGPRTDSDLANYVQSTVNPEPDKKTGMLAVTYSFGSPAFAAEFLADVVQATNDYIKEQDRAINLQYVDYVSRQLENANNSNLAQREALSSLLIQQERSLMMTGVNVPYAAASMDRPVVMSNNPLRRFLVLYSVVGLLCGVGAAALLAFVPDRLRFWSRNWTRL